MNHGRLLLINPLKKDKGGVLCEFLCEFTFGAICGVRAPNKDAGFLKSIKVFTPGESSIYGLFTCGGLPKVRNSPQPKGPHKDGQRRASQIRKSWDFLCLVI